MQNKFSNANIQYLKEAREALRNLLAILDQVPIAGPDRNIIHDLVNEELDDIQEALQESLPKWIKQAKLAWEEEQTEKEDRKFEERKRKATLLQEELKDILDIDAEVDGSTVVIDGIEFTINEYEALAIVHKCLTCMERYSIPIHNQAKAGLEIYNPTLHACPQFNPIEQSSAEKLAEAIKGVVIESEIPF